MIHSPNENKIVSVANALAMGAEVTDIRKDLIEQGFSEYGVFLTVKAAEVHNRLRDSLFPVKYTKREYPTTRLGVVKVDS